MPTYNFPLYQTGDGNENWVSIPYNGTGIDTTVDKGNSIAALFTPVSEDSITIYDWDSEFQLLSTTSGDYIGSAWHWDPLDGYSVSTGAMEKVFINHPSELPFNITWKVSGTVPPAGTVKFKICQTGDGNENWISLPFDQSAITDTVDLGNSLAAKFSPNSGDSITIYKWDPEFQLLSTTSGDYIGSAWHWDPPDGYLISAGEPLIVYPSHPAGVPWCVWWP
jgi:hypothetical protein